MRATPSHQSATTTTTPKQEDTATDLEPAGRQRVGVRAEATEDKGSNFQALRQVRKEAGLQDNE